MGTSDDAGEDRGPGSGLVREVLRIARSAPDLLPAQAARLTVARLGPAAARAVDPRCAGGSELPDAGRAAVTRRTCRAVDVEGAFVGGPVLLLVPIAFCAALLRQLRGVLELAALAGRDAADPERAVELLLLQDAYDDADAAREAIATAADRAKADGEEFGRSRGFAAWWALGLRAAKLLGLLTPDRRPRSRWAQLGIQAGRWLLVTVVFLVGLVAPLVWLPYMSWSYDRATRRLLDRAADFYLGAAGEEPRPGRERRRLDPAMIGALARGLASILFGAVLVTLTVLTDLRLLGSHWPVLALLLTASSLLTGLLWLRGRRRRRSGSRGAR